MTASATALDNAPARPTRRATLVSAARLPEVRWAGVAVGFFAIGGALQLLNAPAPTWWSAYLVCYVAGGWEPALAGIRALRERTLDVDLLMVVAALAAAGIGQIADGALLIVIFATSGALEAFVTRRTADSVDALLTLAPERALRRSTGDDVESWEEVSVDQIRVHDEILIRPGDRVAVDGTVAEGHSDVDQAAITGESLPTAKRPGDRVFAGTVNGFGALRIRVTTPAHESLIARIATMVREASETKARTQLTVERVERRYSVAVVVATLAILTAPLLLGSSFQPALLRAMTFMIVASPCAVVLATMPALLSVIANAGRHGVLLRSALALEQLQRVDVVAFDKTGTLTSGAPTLAEVVTADDGIGETELLILAAAAERGSEHPIARAVLAAADARRLTLPDATAVAAQPGRGVTARVAGHTVTVVAATAVESPSESLTGTIEAAATNGRTAVVVAVDGDQVGVLVVADTLRRDAAHTVTELRAAGLRPLLLTGDHEAAARRIAQETGIDDVRSGLLPTEKLAAVERLQRDGHRVLVVGDGINDAPALATAEVGVALGDAGSALAVEAADLILVRDDLGTLPRAVRLARRARRVVRANLVFAACVITGLVAWDVIGTLPLPLGVAGHEGSTVIVGLNGLRLLRRRAWADA